MFEGTFERRATAFFEYAEEHPNEATEALQASADDSITALLRSA
jgi:hypothetical protein